MTHPTQAEIMYPGQQGRAGEDDWRIELRRYHVPTRDDARLGARCTSRHRNR